MGLGTMNGIESELVLNPYLHREIFLMSCTDVCKLVEKIIRELLQRVVVGWRVVWLRLLFLDLFRIAAWVA